MVGRKLSFVSLPFRFALAAGILGLLAGPSVAQRRPPRNAQEFPEVARWQPSKLTAEELAKRVDARLASLKWVEVDAQTAAQMPRRQGNGGMSVASRIQDRRMFDIQFPKFSFEKRNEISKTLFRADGKTAELRNTGNKAMTTKPVGQIRLANGAKPADWAAGHPGYVFAAIFGEQSISALTRQVKASGSGFVAKVEQRSYRRLNRPVTQYRYSIGRTPAAGKASGPMQLSFIVDGQQWLPVTVASESNFKGKEPLIVVNRFRWKVSKKPFDPKQFSFKKS